jgi:hypothetical protein
MHMFASTEIGGSVGDETASSSVRGIRVYNGPGPPALTIYIVWWKSEEDVCVQYVCV